MNQVRSLRFVSEHYKLIMLDVWLDMNRFAYYGCFCKQMIREEPHGSRRGLVTLRLLD